jgi:hypothetical protein
MTDNGEAGVRWFYVQEGRRKGPVGVAELVALVLGGEVPEDALIWRAGLGEWVKANSVEEIQRELPPPIPKQDGGPPEQGGAPSREETLAEELDGGESEETGPVGTNPSGGTARLGGRRRRHHRTRIRLAASRRRWLVPFLVMLFVVVVVLWYLLRRFNEVPQGQVILQGAVSEEARPVGAPWRPVRPSA